MIQIVPFPYSANVRGSGRLRYFAVKFQLMSKVARATSYQKIKKVILILLLGIISAGILFILIVWPKGERKVLFTYQEQKTNKIIPPYYEKKEFKQPADLKHEPLVFLEKRIRIPIVMYHYVEYVKDIGDVVKNKLTINPDLFDREMKALKESDFETYYVKDVPAMLDGRINIASKSAVLTFDDGYEDFYSDVLPILKKYDMKATLYVIVDFIGRKGFLKEDQIREIVKSGIVEVGAHTLDHLYLKNLPASVTRKQIFESKKILEDKFGIKVETFAYPYGAFSQETIDLVKQAFFSAAVSVIPGAYHSKDSLFYMYRIRAGALGGSNAARVLEGFNK